ncbi:conserved protein of unknown function [Pararobbsia alpina]|uniref:hypothetical protein n=1 Tax=Pararobbsia alpina TaxID=621374 RepID=UPI0039A6BDBA
MKPIKFRDAHVDVHISAEAQELAASVIDVNLTCVDTHVELTDEDRAESERLMLDAKLNERIREARALNAQRGITGPRVQIGAAYLPDAVRRTYAYVRGY